MSRRSHHKTEVSLTEVKSSLEKEKKMYGKAILSKNLSDLFYFGYYHYHNNATRESIYQFVWVSEV